MYLYCGVFLSGSNFQFLLRQRKLLLLSLSIKFWKVKGSVAMITTISRVAKCPLFDCLECLALFWTDILSHFGSYGSFLHLVILVPDYWIVPVNIWFVKHVFRISFNKMYWCCGNISCGITKIYYMDLMQMERKEPFVLFISSLNTIPILLGN